MQQLLPRLFARPLLFARGGYCRAHAVNSLPAFEEALRVGATALSTDLWVTKDDVPILSREGIVRSGLRRHSLRSRTLEETGDRYTTLEAFLQAIPATVDVSIDLKDSEGFGLLSTTLGKTLRDPTQIWICHPQVEILEGWKKSGSSIRFVHTTSHGSISTSPEQHARSLREAGLSACRMQWRDWSGGLVALYHRFDIACFAWGLDHEHEMTESLRMGIDGIYTEEFPLLLGVYERSGI